MPVDVPLSRDRILAAAEETVRRFGPAKATVVDVARVLGVTHASVYRHFASKAELREAVVATWIERTMPPLRAVANAAGTAPERLRRFIDALVAVKRKRAAEDPELFTAYRALAGESMTIVQPHVGELVELIASIIAAGVADGVFDAPDPIATGRAVLNATMRFHNPVHAAEWTGPNIDAELDGVWRLLMNGLRAR